jgi:hypothetical protein
MRIALPAILVCLALAASAPPAAAAAGSATPLWLTLPELPPAPAPDAQGYVVHDGARLYYAAYGAGRPVILLHGASPTATTGPTRLPRSPAPAGASSPSTAAATAGPAATSAATPTS